MKSRKIHMTIALGCVLASVMTACSTPDGGALLKEYNDYAAVQLPPPPAPTSDRFINDLGKVSNLNYAFVLAQVKAYVARTSVHPEYIAFLNRVNDLEKIGEMQKGITGKEKIVKYKRDAAMKKVAEEILKADEKRIDSEKVWPKVEAGYLTVYLSNPNYTTGKVLSLSAITGGLIAKDYPRVEKTAKAEVNKYKKAGFDPATIQKLKDSTEKLSAVTTIAAQSVAVTKGIAFLTEHTGFNNDMGKLLRISKRKLGEIEYEYFKNAAPRTPIHRCPFDRDIDAIAIATTNNYLLAQKYMRDFITYTSTRRQLIAFNNDIKFLETEDKMEHNAAVAKVIELTVKADAEVKDPAQKRWPKILAAMQAKDELNDPKKQKALYLTLAENNAKLAASVLSLVAKCTDSKYIASAHCDVPTVSRIVTLGESMVQTAEITIIMDYLRQQNATIKLLKDYTSLKK